MKVVLAFALLTLSSAANAIQVFLVSHTYQSDGTPKPFITDGSHTSGIAGPSTAVWDWDGTTLTSTGLYSSVFVISTPTPTTSATVLSDQVMNLSIDTVAGMASVTGAGGSYRCLEGTFLASLGSSACGGYEFGPNGVNDSGTIWGPGTTVSQAILNDDVRPGSPRTIAAFDLGNASFDGTTLLIDNGVSLGHGGTGTDGSFLPNVMTFTTAVPAPAAVWLFGSALGLFGWMRRK